VRSSDSAVSRSTGDTSDGFRHTRLVYHHLDGILIAQCSKPADYKNSGTGRSGWLPLVRLTARWSALDVVPAADSVSGTASGTDCPQWPTAWVSNSRTPGWTVPARSLSTSSGLFAAPRR